MVKSETSQGKFWRKYREPSMVNPGNLTLIYLSVFASSASRSVEHIANAQ